MRYEFIFPNYCLSADWWSRGSESLKISEFFQQKTPLWQSMSWCLSSVARGSVSCRAVGHTNTHSLICTELKFTFLRLDCNFGDIWSCRLAILAIVKIGWKRGRLAIPWKKYPQLEQWGRQHHSVGLYCRRRVWCISQNRQNHEGILSGNTEENKPAR